MQAALDTARAFVHPGAAVLAPLSGPNLWAAWRRVGLGYVARKHTGRVTVLLSNEYRRRANVHVNEWLTVAPRADVHAIAGEHLACITDHIDTTAKLIANALAAS